MLIETFMRKQLGLKAHTVTKVEETERFMGVHIDRREVDSFGVGSVGNDAGKCTASERRGNGAIYRYGSCR